MTNDHEFRPPNQRMWLYEGHNFKFKLGPSVLLTSKFSTQLSIKKQEIYKRKIRLIPGLASAFLSLRKLTLKSNSDKQVMQNARILMKI